MTFTVALAIVAAVLLAIASVFAGLYLAERGRRIAAERMVGFGKPEPARTIPVKEDAEARAYKVSQEIQVQQMARRYREKYPKLSEEEARQAAERAITMMGGRPG